LTLLCVGRYRWTIGMRVGLAALALVPVLASAAGVVDIVECGQTVESGQVGRLRGDLECEHLPTYPFSPDGVRLNGDATLELGGFTIRGTDPVNSVGVYCHSGLRGRCRVNGPGEITGFWAGLNGGGCRMVLRDVVLRGNTNGVVGILRCNLDARDVRVVENEEFGLWVSRLRARDVTVSGNGYVGVSAGRIKARGLTATGNGAEGVGQASIRGRFGRLVDSAVTGNGVTGSGSRVDQLGLDVAGAGRLVLRGTECGRSARLKWPRVVDSSDDRPTIVGSYGCRDD
jgi:hypothetical protein